MNNIYDPNVSPRNHAGLITMLEAINTTGSIPRTEAINLITATGLTAKSAQHIIRRAGRKQAIKASGGKRGTNSGRLSAGPLFDQALTS